MAKLLQAIEASHKSGERYSTREMYRAGTYIQVLNNQVTTNLPYSHDVSMIKYLLSQADADFFSQTEMRNEEMRAEPVRTKAQIWSASLLSSIAKEDAPAHKSNRFWQR